MYNIAASTAMSVFLSLVCISVLEFTGYIIKNIFLSALHVGAISRFLGPSPVTLWITKWGGSISIILTTVFTYSAKDSSLNFEE